MMKIIQEQRKSLILDKIKDELNIVRNYTPKVGILGDTGVGKSSLCNALFGSDIAKISDVEACTRQPQEISIGNKDNTGIVLVDVPGIGEDPERHYEYIKLYKTLIPQLDLIIWAIKADDRKYLSSLHVYQDILEPNIDKCPVVFVITQADKIEPYRDWDVENNKPGIKQVINLHKKANDISSRFNVCANKIISVSSTDNFNLVELINKIVEILPNQKKFAFTRETREENVSKKAMRNAEKGIYDHIKENVGEAWELIKEEAIEIMIETAKEYIPKIINSFRDWVKSFW